MFGSGSGSGFGGIALYELGRQDEAQQRTNANAARVLANRLFGNREVVVDVGPLLAENNALRYQVARFSQLTAENTALCQQVARLSQDLASSRAECQRRQEWSEGAWEEILELRAARAKDRRTNRID